MPTRRGVAFILLLWAGVTGYVVHRDVWPRYFGDAPPTVRIELSDEATQTVPARWIIYRGDEKIGSLTTRLVFLPSEESFQFRGEYQNLEFVDKSFGLSCELPELTTTLTVSRGGDLRGQGLKAKLGAVAYRGITVAGTSRAARIPGQQLSDSAAAATATVEGTVRDGQLFARCKVKSVFGELDEPLDPVPVPAGQVLNPLQPVNRLAGVRGGIRWSVPAADPLGDAVEVLVRKLLSKQFKMLADLGKSARDPELIAKVGDKPEKLPLATKYRKLEFLRPNTGEDVEPECWVIEYRGERLTARTWVRVADGKVMLQEAALHGDTLRLERED